jgi:hypothetical protein
MHTSGSGLSNVSLYTEVHTAYVYLYTPLTQKYAHTYMDNAYIRIRVVQLELMNTCIHTYSLS